VDREAGTGDDNQSVIKT